MIWSWWKKRRRAKLLRRPIPADWISFLEQNVRLFHWLTDAERRKLLDDVRILVHEKHWEGCLAMRIDDEVKVTIAGQIALLGLGFQELYFDKTPTILVYPDAYLAPHRQELAGGGMLEGWQARLGEAWYRGPVVLAWSEVIAGGRGESDGQNVVVHEFAHQLDMLDGHADGVPPMPGNRQRRLWQQTMRRQYHAFRRLVQRGTTGPMDDQAAEDPAEFFAIATEAFIMQPRMLQSQMPVLYNLLRDYYRQDPAARPGWDAPF